MPRNGDKSGRARVRVSAAACRDVRDLLGSFGAEAPWSILERLADELDESEGITAADFVDIVIDCTCALRKGVRRA